MKLAIMPKEPTWWVWLVMVGTLAAGLAGHVAGFIATIALSLAQTVFFWQKHGSLRPLAVQIRLGCTVLRQSQRDCDLQPKVARNELPWVTVRK